MFILIIIVLTATTTPTVAPTTPSTPAVRYMAASASSAPAVPAASGTLGRLRAIPTSTRVRVVGREGCICGRHQGTQKIGHTYFRHRRLWRRMWRRRRTWRWMRFSTIRPRFFSALSFMPPAGLFTAIA